MSTDLSRRSVLISSGSFFLLATAGRVQLVHAQSAVGYVDPHCHTFNSADVPLESFSWMLKRRFPKLWQKLAGSLVQKLGTVEEADYEAELKGLGKRLSELAQGQKSSKLLTLAEAIMTEEEAIAAVRSVIIEESCAETIAATVPGASSELAEASAVAWLNRSDTDLSEVSAQYASRHLQDLVDDTPILSNIVQLEDSGGTWTITNKENNSDRIERFISRRMDTLSAKADQYGAEKTETLQAELKQIEEVGQSSNGAQKLLDDLADSDQKLATFLEEELPPPQEPIRAGSFWGLVNRFQNGIDSVRHARSSRRGLINTLTSDYPDISLFTPALVDFDHWVSPATVAQLPLFKQLILHDRISRVAALGGYGKARVHPLVPFNPLKEALWWRAKADSAFDADTPTDYDPFGMGREGRYVRFVPDLLPALTGPFQDRVLPVSADDSPLSLVRKAIEQGGFVGVKIYPPNGFAPLKNRDVMNSYDPDNADFPFEDMRRVGGENEFNNLPAWIDQAMGALYAYCEAMGVPILTHANRSNGFGKGFDDLVAPKLWTPVLQEWPKLRLCFGHFGHLERDGDGVISDTWAWGYTSHMTPAHPNVFADMSNSEAVFSRKYRKDFLPFLRELLQLSPELPGRLMYGSDWYMNQLFRKKHTAFPSVFHDMIGEALEDVPELDVSTVRASLMRNNAFRWLGIVDRNGGFVSDSTPGTRQRLLRWYDGAPTPGWLG